MTDANARVSVKTGAPDRRYVKADPHAPALTCAPSHGYKWSVPVNPAGLAKHYLGPALVALRFARCRWHDLNNASLRLAHAGCGAEATVEIRCADGHRVPPDELIVRVGDKR